MTHAITLDNLHNLSDEALWALFDETQALLEELPCGCWERGIARANLRLISSLIERRRVHVSLDVPRRPIPPPLRASPRAEVHSSPRHRWRWHARQVRYMRGRSAPASWPHEGGEWQNAG